MQLRFDPDQMRKNALKFTGSRQCDILCGDTVVGIWIESTSFEGLTERVVAVGNDPQIQAKLDVWFAAYERRKAEELARWNAEVAAELKERRRKELADARKAMGLKEGVLNDD